MRRLKYFIRSFFCVAMRRWKQSRESIYVPTTELGEEEPSSSPDDMSYKPFLVAPDPWKKVASDQDASPDKAKLHREPPSCPSHVPGVKVTKNAVRGGDGFLAKTTPGQNTSVFPLPLEIFDMIWAYLTPPESRAAFALTCRLFYRHFKLTPISTKATETLQLWLEKDVPNLYFCWLCNKLHTWCCGELRPMTEYQGPHPTRVLSYDKRCRYRKRSEHPASLGNAHNIKLETARLITNRHLYGEQHGPSPDALSFIRHRPVAGQKTGDVMIEESRRLRIINGELYVRESVVMYHKDGDEDALHAYLDLPGGQDIMPPACRHIASYSRISKAKLSRDVEGGYVSFIGPVLSCKYCYTDYHIRAQWQPADGPRPAGWVVGGTKWCALGSCRDLRDDKWNNAAMESIPFFAQPRSTHWSAGQVLRTWAAGEGSANVEDPDLDLIRNDIYPPIFVGPP